MPPIAALVAQEWLWRALQSGMLPREARSWKTPMRYTLQTGQSWHESHAGLFENEVPLNPLVNG